MHEGFEIVAVWAAVPEKLQHFDLVAAVCFLLVDDFIILARHKVGSDGGRSGKAEHQEQISQFFHVALLMVLFIVMFCLFGYGTRLSITTWTESAALTSSTLTPPIKSPLCVTAEPD